jgi:sugar lactone lactonase YvrE
VTEFSAGITPNSVPVAITAGPDGNLWFTQHGSNQVGRITPKGKVTEFSTGITASSGLDGIAVGPDGNLWFTEDEVAKIGRISPGVSSPVGMVTEFSAGITPGSGPAAIAAGPDGNLWFTEFNASKIGRITPKGKVTEFSTGITPGSYPNRLTAGPDDNVWFEQQSDEIGRITTGLPSAPRRVMASPRSKSAVVTWAPPGSAGADAVTGYRVTAAPGGEHCATSGKRTCTVRGLRNGTRYRFTVTARNTIGAGPRSRPPATVTAGAPSAPQRLRVAFPRPGNAAISWDVPRFPGGAPISSYQLRWSFDGGHSWSAWVSTNLRRHARRSGRVKGRTYLVDVRARNRDGAGPSAMRSFTQRR